MSYIEKSLSAGEKVEGLFKLHAFAWLPTIIWVVLGCAVLAFTWQLAQHPLIRMIGFAFGGLAVLFALYEMLQLKFIEQGVTNKRVIFKRGIIGRHTEEMKLTSVETVEIRQGVLGRIFNFGTVKVTGRGISDVVFKGIDDPMGVKRRIEGVSNPAQ